MDYNNELTIVIVLIMFIYLRVLWCVVPIIPFFFL